MEEVFLRFPHLAEIVFKKLNNQNLSKCLEVGQSWKLFIDDNNLIWTRIKKKYPIQNEAQIKPIDRYILTSINGDKYCTTDLHLAALTGQTEIFKFLFEEDFLTKKNIDPYDLGMTPFHLAAAKGRLNICRLIVDKIGNPSKGKYLPYWNGRTIDDDKMKEMWNDVSSILKAQSKEAFEIACQNRQEMVARFLLENSSTLELNLARCFHDSYIKTYSYMAEFIVKYASETFFDFNRALKDACSHGYGSMEIVKLLIGRMGIEKTDFNGVFQNACRHGYKNMKKVKFLIERMVREKMYVSEKGLSKVEKLIIEKSAVISRINFNEKDKYGQSAFHVVCRNGRTDFVEFLIDKSKELKIDLNAQDNQGMTGFHLACKNGKTLRNPWTTSTFGKFG